MATLKARRGESPRSWIRRWSALGDDELLKLRLCDLGLKLERSPVGPLVDRLYQELEEKGLRLRPHVWLSAEWFSPDGIPGIAVPFYLAHDRLRRLEKKMMLDVEGGPNSQCMKLLRHEAGHAICTAYRLHYRSGWRQTFGAMGQPYPDFYRPRPQSRDFVQHLDWWYAQAHPAEDFAETFAVWLKPSSRWRQQYRGWRALAKLEYVDELMWEITDLAPVVRSKRQVEPLRHLKSTLADHYDAKHARYGKLSPDIYDRDLLRLFSADFLNGTRPTAAQFLRQYRPRIRASVARWTGEYQYTIDLVLREMIERCKTLKLRLDRPEAQTLSDATTLVTVQTMRFLYRKPPRIVV